MTKKITSKVCKSCGKVFAYSHRKQMFCDATCSFNHKVTKKDDPNECWEWKGSSHFFGYGDFRFDGKYYRAHVYSFDINIGGRVKSDHVLHSCDNPSCTNPNHLSLGNQASNMRDMAEKERSGMRILTNKQVLEIKKLLNGNLTQFVIADMYNISQPTVSAIKMGRLHRYVV